jgi:peptidoglycan/xylan/chitin deacetylase (PgdA/CDA1 family)
MKSDVPGRASQEVIDLDAMSLSRRTFLGVVTAAGLSACAANARPGETASPSAATDAPVKTEPAASTTSASGAASSTAASTVATTAPAATTIAPAPTTAPPSVNGAPAKFINHGSRDSGKVALTFHAAGDPGRASALLDLLKKSGTPITVFAVGSWVQANPKLMARIVADGHELANHTWSHGAMRTMASGDLLSEINKAAEAIKAVNGSAGHWFRPSQIEVPTDAILAAAGKAGYGVSVGYDLDSLDFQDPGAAAVRKNVIDNVQAGNIVSLHFDHQNTIDALPAIIDHLNAKNLAPVTVSGLLG